MSGTSPIVIAHRGASGYLPEHTLPSVVLAHAQGADYIEQDVVLTKDGIPIVLHDIRLDATTNVAAVFPGRQRHDGHYYAIDFSLQEIRQLCAFERVDEGGSAVYPERFRHRGLPFGVPSLADEIELILELNRTTGRQVGFYIELKAPEWHQAQGSDITKALTDILAYYQLLEATELVFIQCFSPRTLQAFAAKRCALPLIQLIGDNTWGEADVDFDAMRTPKGLQAVAEYAQGIGPWIPHVLNPDATALTEDAHKLQLAVHPYTVRKDALAVPVPTIDALHEALFLDAGVDGVFTDFPDLTRQFIDQNINKEFAE